jgi:phosphoribosylamine--glycine ligase
MKVLVVGGGGREHALAWSIKHSALNPSIYIAPGNAGTAQLGENLPIGANDIDALLAFAGEASIDLTIVGPEQPLVDGMVDRFEEAGLAIVGPSAWAAQLEGSKQFAKTFMQRHGIPTAAYKSFSASQLDEALAYVRSQPVPIVVKADGLAAGKGVIICESHDDAEETLQQILAQGMFGDAGTSVVIEEHMTGEEASIFALTDGAHYELMVSSQDHKRIGEGDTGLNTGGMGAYAPAPVVTDAVLAQVRELIVEPALDGMRKEGHPYRGFLYCGLMIKNGFPRVVEFNCRMGDPEAQAVLPLVKSDLLEAFIGISRGTLESVPMETASGAAACVVLASDGYPGSYEKGFEITGLEDAESEHATVFHAGTSFDGDRVVTSGGRVLAVTGTGSDLKEALAHAYAGVDRISFAGVQYRKDIGHKGLKRLETSQ